MNPTLLVLAHQAFDRVDPAGRNMIDPQDMLLNYDATRHPDVATGQRTAEDVMQELLDTFDVGAVTAGKITRDEFINYYHNISAALRDDDYLEIILRRTWHIGDDVGLTKLMQQKEKQAAASGGKVMGRIKEAQNFNGEYWGADTNPGQQDSARRPNTSNGYRTMNYNSTAPAQPAMLVAPMGDQSFGSRPQSANRSGVRGGSRTLQPTSNSNAMDEKIKLTQRQAILLFNENKFADACMYFQEVLCLLQLVYPANHPECIKAEKSILLTQRKLMQQH